MSCQHPGPLAEDDGFVAVAGDFIAQNLAELAQFGGGFLVLFGRDFFIVQGQRVADDAHLDQAHQQDLALLGGKRNPPGVGNQPGKGLLEFVVGLPLGIGHLNEEVVVHAFGQIGEHFGARAAQ